MLGLGRLRLHWRDAPANGKTSSWDGPKTYSLASPSICTHTSPSSALSPQASTRVTVPSRLSPCSRVRRRWYATSFLSSHAITLTRCPIKLFGDMASPSWQGLVLEVLYNSIICSINHTNY